uniref:Uncharacterized protein n=1 Tax=Rhizophora mucronata TaxID=61149 RepID=A0A2P2NHN6_RHIMU
MLICRMVLNSLTLPYWVSAYGTLRKLTYLYF